MMGSSRKRLRRDTRSCYPCRSRKVKCQLAQEDVDTCAECVKRGVSCTRDAPDEGPKASSDGAETHRPAQSRTIESALMRVESLLKQLVETQESRVESGGLDVSSSPLHWNSSSLPSQTDESLGLLEQFDSLFHSVSPLPPPPPSVNAEPNSRDSLAGLVPTAKDAVAIVSSTTAWLWGAETPPGSILNPEDNLRLIQAAAISEGTAIYIAKSLLLFALYMQQLPAGFDTSTLDVQNVENAIASIVQKVNVFLLASDDDSSSLDFLECLMLLASIYLNDALIRKAWMTFRRGLDLARWKGLPDSFSISQRDSDASEAALRRRLWLNLVSGDCHCSLLLGWEASVTFNPFGPDAEGWRDASAEEEACAQRLISLVVIKIARRNFTIHQDGWSPSLQDSERETIEIDEDLERIHNSFAATWWKSPTFREEPSLSTGKDANRLMVHFWFFQARLFAHLPFALSPGYADREKSLSRCMEACRITLHRYLGLQHAKDHLSRCRTVDQAVFVAALVLLLAMFHLKKSWEKHSLSHHDSDEALVEQVILSFKAVGHGSPREHVLKRSHQLLSSLLVATTEGDEAITRVDPKERLPTGKSANVSELERVFSTIRSLIRKDVAVYQLLGGFIGHL